MSRQFLPRNAIGNRIKYFAKVQINSIYNFPFVQYMSHLIEEDQVRQVVPAFQKAVVTAIDYLVVHLVLRLSAPLSYQSSE